jgi:hypothetical protein
VTVEAQRKAIDGQVRAFVHETLHLENYEGAPRWNAPVCPTVIGLSREEGEFILQRLSEIARSAGVPLDKEQCKQPNLYVIVTTEPSEVLKQWGKKTHWRIFGDGMPKAIDAFIDAKRPVRAWYNSSEGGASMSPGTGYEPPGLGLEGLPTGSSVPIFSGPTLEASRIVRNAIWSLDSVLVIVDKSRVSGVTIGQLADYIGMQGFCRIKPTAYHSEAPTILTLFEGAGARVTGLTAWDEALLESLYHTNPALIQQPMIMASRMVRRLVPEVKAKMSSPEK